MTPTTSPARPTLNAGPATCLYFACPDVDAVYLHLLGKGIALNPPRVAGYGMKQLYLTDPDGFGICFQWKA